MQHRVSLVREVHPSAGSEFVGGTVMWAQLTDSWDCPQRRPPSPSALIPRDPKPPPQTMSWVFLAPIPSHPTGLSSATQGLPANKDPPIRHASLRLPPRSGRRRPHLFLDKGKLYLLCSVLVRFLQEMAKCKRAGTRTSFVSQGQRFCCMQRMGLLKKEILLG